MDNDLTGKYEIVVFSDDWFGLPFSCKHLLKYFLPEIPLIWVETIGLRAPRFNLYDIKRSTQKISSWFKNEDSFADDLPENLRILNPFQIPYNRFKLVRGLNKSKMVRSLADLTKYDNNKYRVVLTTWPFLGNLMGHLDEDLSIYYRVDDFSEFPGVNRQNIERLEHEIIDKVDMVVGSAENLCQLSNGQTAKYLPHGVDYEHFSSLSLQQSKPDLFNGLPSPRIGFFGLLNSWLDLELVSQVADDFPDWSFILIGPSQMPKSLLPGRPNMHYIGPVNYDQLPAYASHFDVGIIPFKINKLTVAVNPLKLMEYFAAGLPVVSTPLPEVQKYRELVHIGSDKTSFAEAIKQALANKDQQSREVRQQVARSTSWPAKAQELRNWIEDSLLKKIEV
jgi:glycosyltransferase involved in cell wall biosynthesis